MRHIFIDLGSYTGDSFLDFMCRQDLPVEPDKFDVYLFEPNPRFEKVLHKLYTTFLNIQEVSNEAAWLEDGVQKLALDTNPLAYGSTLMPGKKDIWDTFDKIDVKTFDFSKWISQIKNSYIIVKMDIEGAEFPLLAKMLKDRTIKHINKLWVEFHPNKVKEYTTTDKDNLITEISKYTEFQEWH